MKQAFVNVDNLRLRYLESSDNVISAGRVSNGRHVLFIHGLGSSADRWLDIPDALSLYFHTVAIDLPGFGWSDRPADVDYTIGNFVNVISKFMRKIDMDKASLVGHSLGGYIAAQLAIEHCDLVDRLVLVDSSGMLKGPTPLLRQYLDVAMNPSRESVRKVFEQLVADPIRIPDLLVDAFIYRMNQPNSKHAFKSAFDNSVNTQIGASRLRQISAPTLIIWGMQDKLIPPEYFEVFRKGIRNSDSVIINDAGHAPFAEKPAIASELFRRFLV